jgi:hypothetical protein
MYGGHEHGYRPCMEGCRFELHTSLDAHFNFLLSTESSCKAPSLQLHHLLASLTSAKLGSQFSLSAESSCKAPSLQDTKKYIVDGSYFCRCMDINFLVSIFESEVF